MSIKTPIIRIACVVGIGVSLSACMTGKDPISMLPPTERAYINASAHGGLPPGQPMTVDAILANARGDAPAPPSHVGQFSVSQEAQMARTAEETGVPIEILRAMAAEQGQGTGPGAAAGGPALPAWAQAHAGPGFRPSPTAAAVPNFPQAQPQPQPQPQFSGIEPLVVKVPASSEDLSQQAVMSLGEFRGRLIAAQRDTCVVTAGGATLMERLNAQRHAVTAARILSEGGIDARIAVDPGLPPTDLLLDVAIQSPNATVAMGPGQ